MSTGDFASTRIENKMSMQRHLLVTSASVRTEGTYNAPSVAVAMQGSFAEAPCARVAEVWSSSRSSTSGARAPRTERRLGARCSSRCGETAAAGIPCARGKVRARIPQGCSACAGAARARDEEEEGTGGEACAVVRAREPGEIESTETTREIERCVGGIQGNIEKKKEKGSGKKRDGKKEKRER